MPREVFGFLPAAGGVWLRAVPAPSPQRPSAALARGQGDTRRPGTPALGTRTPGASPGPPGTPGCCGWAFPSCHPKETPRPGFDLLAKEHKRGRAPTSPPTNGPGTGLPGAGTRPRACTRVRVTPAVPLRLPRGSGQEEPVDSNEGSQRAGWGWGEANAQGAARPCPKRPRCRRRAPAEPEPAPFLHGRCPHRGPAPPRTPSCRGSAPSGCCGRSRARRRAAQDAERLSSRRVDAGCD